MHLRLRSTLAAALMAVGLVALSPAMALANVTPWDTNSCAQNSMDYPHISSDPRWGVLQKATWQCNTAPATVHMNTAYMGWWLWVCPSAGPKDENWITSNCTYKGSNNTSIYWDSSHVGWQYSLWMPWGGGRTIGTGWWVACAQWYSSGIHGNGQVFLTFSDYRYINLPS
jgi:hypothetical protein